MEWVRACSLPPIHPAPRAPQPVPGPAELSVSGSLTLCCLLDPTCPDYHPAHHQLVPFPVGWADALCLGMYGLSSVSMGLGRTPARYPFHCSDPGVPVFFHAGTRCAFLHVLCSTSPPVSELGTLGKKARMDPHLEETTDSSQLKVRL